MPSSQPSAPTSASSTRSARPVGTAVNGWNAEYLDQQYQSWKADPSAIQPDLHAFFQGFDLAAGRSAATGAAASTGDIRFHLGVAGLIDAYRADGHIAAKTDPFGREPVRPPSLALASHQLSEADLDQPIGTSVTAAAPTSTLRQLVAMLERAYCGHIGIQTAQISNPVERRWLQDRCERNQGHIELPRGQKAHILERLFQAELFERFLHARYPGEKRFSLEGGEALIVLLDHMIEASANLGVQEMVLGMAHRGRLNVLRNIMGKTLEQIFTEFEDAWAGLVQGGGDVKYHRGYSSERQLAGGKTMKLVMASNPSHLESVNGVVLGRCRAKQRLAHDTKERSKVVPLLIHGDAAAIGQGIVAECLNYAQLDGYKVGGCLHAVINNLIGFTTGPEDARTSRYCTDLALMLECPILHVNGEHPEAVVTCAQIAVEYRQKFKKDVFVDIVCYRKYGHNEQDEASFTQPHLTALVQKKQSETALKAYSTKLLGEGVINEMDVSAISERLTQALEQAQKTAKSSPLVPTIDPGGWRWKGVTGEYSHKPIPTGVPISMLEEVCKALGSVPNGFSLNPKLVKLLADRAALPRSKSISYADAESLAYGTLLLEGCGVRISGQDSRRGTFSHRHAVLRDTQTEERYIPLNNMRPVSESPDDAGKPGPDGRITQGKLCVYDSPLSEGSVMAFDYGYSLADPHMLVCWEAQFGDFANGAQTLIDQYLVNSEVKWERWSGLVLLLPHGYEGAGPEHSSAWLERFLLHAAENNIQVVNPSTAAQCFHMFRRQIKAPFRKPLVVMTPKSMLRTPTSTIEELTSGHFRTLIDDPVFDRSGKGAADRSKVKKVLWCSGKIYHELAARREALALKDIAIVRVEQFYPFDLVEARRIAALYPNAARRAGGHAWVQEEPRNKGGFLFISDIFRTDKELAIDFEYIGRPPMAASALGSKKADKKQQEAVLACAIGPLPASAADPKHGSNGTHDAKPAGSTPKTVNS